MTGLKEKRRRESGQRIEAKKRGQEAGTARSNFIHNVGFFKEALKCARSLAMSAFVLSCLDLSYRWGGFRLRAAGRAWLAGHCMVVAAALADKRFFCPLRLRFPQAF
ncbi:hypothetical protein CTP10_R57920 [Cupriavidus sp. P-10]|uniref:hypothetical protein n=1 Tax=Cupriavidus sp. P-10 TaxID=2027911 RepID=UPI0011C1A701|nr:hypothetical protein [Cupriavidus sp. P-10]BDB28381.1 hypothetical protein CTP10_R57920 [Cupriavidus sp. P-10]